jgi:hypothetical protein
MLPSPSAGPPGAKNIIIRSGVTGRGMIMMILMIVPLAFLVNPGLHVVELNEVAGKSPVAAAPSSMDWEKCRAYKSRDYLNFNASLLPVVSIANQRALALGGYKKIAKGSGDVIAAGPFVNALSRWQHSNQLFGSVGELGVHHGRFTSFLFATARSGEALVVADLFEDHQSENVDLSGKGDYRQFVKGLATYGLSESDLRAVHRGSTADIPLDWSSREGFSPFRLVSVDAGHTANLTLNDLRLVSCNLLEGGITILDDWFHSGWPGVVEGYYRLVHQLRLDAYPFLSCEGKLYLTNTLEHHWQYYKALRNDPDLGAILSPYSSEKERGKVLYEMSGVNYLRCLNRRDATESDLQQMWSKRVY